MNQGCDFLRNHQSPSVDFATIHLWPDSWLTNVDDEKRIQFARRWINCHVDVCTQLLKKPLVLAEFGWKIEGRAAYYDKVCGERQYASHVLWIALFCIASCDIHHSYVSKLHLLCRFLTRL